MRLTRGESHIPGCLAASQSSPGQARFARSYWECWINCVRRKTREWRVGRHTVASGDAMSKNGKRNALADPSRLKPVDKEDKEGVHVALENATGTRTK